MAGIRDYGYGDSTPYLDGAPRVKGVAKPIEGVSPVCPNCGCEILYEIEVDLKGYPLLKRGKQVGLYLGCPACPWASPMLARTVTE